MVNNMRTKSVAGQVQNRAQSWQKACVAPTMPPTPTPPGPVKSCTYSLKKDWVWPKIVCLDGGDAGLYTSG